MGGRYYVHSYGKRWLVLFSVGIRLTFKKIVGYSFSRSMTTELVIKALQNAYSSQKPRKGLLLHTDLGSQYTSREFTQHIRKYEMKQSFSHKGCPYDNACIESFHAILKKRKYIIRNTLTIQLPKYPCFSL
ncbi:DDE-type integrase/transposase/recombinase [Priestia aryabhattai]|uniref:DDE-type integrase/transposase/recombinase n=1 Tax=Priestia aryabhattai TaxID=412384 RepID=UPI0009BE98CB